MGEPIRILFIDDDEQILRALKRLLQRDGFALHFTADAASALSLVDEHAIDVVICDQMMPGVTGVDVLSRLMHERPHVVRVLASGSQDRSKAEAAGCVERFLDKPWFGEDLRRDLRGLEDVVRAGRARSA